MSREGELADQLETIGAEVDELAMDRLMAAAAEGETRRPQADKTLTQARRAIEKAVRLLRGADDDHST